MNMLDLLKGTDHPKYMEALARWQPRRPDEPTAVMYLRLRTDRPRLEWQERKCRTAAGHLDASIIDKYLDIGSDEHTSLDLLLQRVREDRDVDYLIIAGIECIAQRPDEYLMLEGRLLARGVRLIVANTNGEPEIPSSGVVMKALVWAAEQRA